MNETIVDVTEILNRQKIAGFNARLLLLAFLVGSDFRQGWDISGAEYAVQLTLSLAAGFVVPLVLGRLADCFGRRRIIVATAFVFGMLALATVIAMASTIVSRRQLVVPITLIAV